MSKLLANLARVATSAHDEDEPFDLHGGHPLPSILQKSVQELQNLVIHGPPFHLSDLPAYLDAAKNLSTIGIDDRKFLLEKLLSMMALLPEGSTFGNKLQQFVIDILYKDLPHPPSGYLALPDSSSATTAPAVNKHVHYAFRSADGSHYNPLFPTLGKAGTPYARSVPSANTTPATALPDPGLVFDTLLRREKFVPHPGGLSNLFFAYADLITHCLFNTNYKDFTINDASSYLDLSVLYGSSQEVVDSVRRKDGTGRLFDDVFADSRVLFMPPSVCALLVLLSRNHNYIAQKILDINEHRTYQNPPPTAEDERIAQDDEIFSRARLVNSTFFMQVILGDYVGAILGLSRDGLTWRLDPLQTMREIGHEFSAKGEGNAVSIEFNVLYRWHAPISEQDAEWTEELFKSIFKGKDLNKLTVEDFMKAARTKMVPPKDVKEWTFSKLKRGENGRFNDGDLANILMNATEASAGAFQARGTPGVLRVIEILSIEQARQWGTCSLNEFRTFMGLKPYKSFKEWNPKEEIYTAAELLYGDINNLELHAGLQAEEAKPKMPGAGLCPGYTISRAILADAVALTRGDRFFTVDFTPQNYTSWGFQDCQIDKSDGSYGGLLPKLLLRTLPNHYTANSAFTLFPFMVPSKIRADLAKLPDSPIDKYIWTRPVLPTGIIKAETYTDVRKVLTEAGVFGSACQKRIHAITGVRGAFVHKTNVHDILFSDENISIWTHVLQYKTRQLISQKAVEHINSKSKYVDIVKDVINLAPVYWIAEKIAGLEIKTQEQPENRYRDQDLYQELADICDYVFLNLDPTHDWALHDRACKTTGDVVHNITAHLTRLSKSVFSITGSMNSVNEFLGGGDKSDRFLKQVLSVPGTHSPEQLAITLFEEVIPTMAAYSKALAHIVDFYLDEDQSEAREAIYNLSNDWTPDSQAKVLAYAREALRLNTPFSEVTRTALHDTLLAGVPVKAGQTVVASVYDANSDQSVFGPDPKAAVLDRTITEPSGIIGLREGLLSGPFFENTVPTVLGAIFSLKDLKRAPGQSGHMTKFVQKSIHGVTEQLYFNSKNQVTPFPSSLVIQYTPELI